MKITLKIFLVIAALITAYFGGQYWLEKNDSTTKPDNKQVQTVSSIILPGEISETTHFAISSTAKPGQTTLVAEAVESFYSAYSAFFEKEISANTAHVKHKLMLYKDRQEFSANNKSSSWAEAYYREPVCYAYFSDTAENPYHWMIHETTHQLNNELAGFKIPKWIDEGLAAYFGASKIENHVLQPGSIDSSAYPIWWLSSLSLSGNLHNDIASGKIIPLRALISGKGGPDIGSNVNLYYIEYWSFTHFLFHFENGRYADRYKKLIRKGGSPEDFEMIVGPLDPIQSQWYEYLRRKTVNGESEIEPELDDAVEITL